MPTHTLLPYQELPRRWLEDHRSLILWHDTGTGKTLTSLSALLPHPGHLTVIGPGSARRAWLEETARLEVPDERWTWLTYTTAKRLAGEDITRWSGGLLILDEAHYLRTENMQNLQLMAAVGMAERLILATATPIVNGMTDLAVLVNLAAGEPRLPTEPRLWDSLYYDAQEGRIRNPSRLRAHLEGLISRYHREEAGYYPSTTTHLHRVVMDRAQLEEYRGHVRRYLYGEEPLEAGQLLHVDWEALAARTRNYFLTATRQISNVAAPGQSSPKLEAILQEITTGPRPAVVFSFYLERGIYALAARLEEEGIRWAAVTGATGRERVLQTVRDYNRGRYRVLLLSSAGSESLDLRGTRQVHVMEPQWNPSKTVQAEGRGVRYGSHIHLPESERQVDIHYWLSVFPPPVRNLSADEYLWEISERKRQVAAEYLEVVEAASIEHSGMS